MFQYSMLSWLNRNNADEISFGELIHQLLEEVQDVALFNAIELVLSLFIEIIASEYSLSLEKLDVKRSFSDNFRYITVRKTQVHFFYVSTEFFCFFLVLVSTYSDSVKYITFNFFGR